MGKRFGIVCAAIALAAFAVPRADALQTFGNTFYTVHVSDTGQVGSWNAITAAGHPTGADNNLLYAGNTVSTNFSSLRVYGPTGAGATTYTFGGAGGGTDMDPFVSGSGASAYGTAGWQTLWNITPVSLSVAQDVFVVGTTYANSAIYHTVNITNTGNNAVSIGWRNLYDWTVDDPAFDDGPSNQLEMLNGTVVVPTTTIEFTHGGPVAADFVRVAAAPPPAGGATYEPLLGLLYDPGLAPLATTAPDVYAYVSWPGSVGTAFDYTPTGLNVTGDSAGLSWWGRTAGTAYQIAAGGSLRFTETIFAVPPGEPPGGVVPEPGTIVLLGSGLLGAAAIGRRRRNKA